MSNKEKLETFFGTILMGLMVLSMSLLPVIF